MRNQQKDENLIKNAQTNEDYSIQNYHEADKKYSLIFRNCKIMVLQKIEN